MNGRLLSPWAVAASGAAVALLAALVGTLMALLGADLSCVGGSGAVGPTPSATAQHTIPAPRLRIYRAAGQRFDIDWAFLASIGTQECGQRHLRRGQLLRLRRADADRLRPRSPCSPGAGPTIWERYEVDGDGDGNHRRKRPRRRDLHRRRASCARTWAPRRPAAPTPPIARPPATTTAPARTPSPTTPTK